MKACAKTDIGKHRGVNQDFVFSSTTEIGSFENLFIVADGMGGHKAGEFASRFVVEELIKYFKIPQLGRDIQSILKDGVRTINQLLFQESNENEELAGTGTTVVIATIKNNVLYVANIGDSRLYFMREKIRQVTNDHSYVEELVSLGEIKRESAYYQSYKNLITRAIGTSEEVELDLFAESVASGDQILMCSDGLSNMIEDAVLEEKLKTTLDIELKVENLISEANCAGGTDNISVIIIAIGEDGEAS